MEIIGKEYKKKIKFTSEFHKVYKLLKDKKVSTVCHSARCPNITECFHQKKITFMILGEICTRHCKYCNISPGKPSPPDINENNRIIEIIKKLQLRYVIITSVTRDDIDGYGSFQYIDLINKIKKNFKNIKIELLIPDFNGNEEILENIAKSSVNVIGHNIETIPSLWNIIRPLSNFNTTIDVLKILNKLKNKFNFILKSGFMVGLGEKEKEIINLMKELKDIGVDVITIGPYFQPSKKHYPVKKIYSDSEFFRLKEIGLKIGFKYVMAGRFVRSSYFAENYYDLIK